MVEGHTITQAFTWNDLGLIASVGYPDTNLLNNTSQEPTRSVTYACANGFLTSIPSYATSISYHVNTMVNRIDHANAVKVDHTIDPDNRSVPGITISLSRAGRSVSLPGGGPAQQVASPALRRRHRGWDGTPTALNEVVATGTSLLRRAGEAAVERRGGLASDEDHGADLADAAVGGAVAVVGAAVGVRHGDGGVAVVAAEGGIDAWQHHRTLLSGTARAATRRGPSSDGAAVRLHLRLAG